VFYHSEQCSFPRSPLHRGQLFLQPNVNPKVVQEVLGHADITLTRNTYSQQSPAKQVEAAAKVDELLTPIAVTEELNNLRE
jgi:integrase